MARSALSILAMTVGPPVSGEKRLNRWTLAIVIIGILIVAGLFSLIYLSTAQASSKNFAYGPPRDNNGSYDSLTVTDVDGPINVIPWSQQTVLINGTITAKGPGSSLSAVNISNSSSNGDVVFRAVFPANAGFFFSQSYTVDVNVFVPSTVRFGSVQISNINGAVQIENLNSTTINVTTVNGAISFGCAYCARVTVVTTNGNVTATFAELVSQGSYNLTATNADLHFSIPSSSSFKLSAIVQNGSILCGLPGCPAAVQTSSLVLTFKTGTASVVLNSGNGQITITGT